LLALSENQMLQGTTLVNSAADWRIIVVQQRAYFHAVCVNTPNRFCLIRCDVINYNEITSPTNPYVFVKMYRLLIYRL